MIIKLYKKCIINSNYDEVFRTQALINSYLQKLSSTEYEYTGMYPLLNGVIQLEYEEVSMIKTDSYDYNYMTIDEDTMPEVNHRLYCFVNNITIINGICMIEYSTDVWHTYLPYWSFRNGLMSKCLRYDNYQMKEVQLPETYISNDRLEPYRPDGYPIKESDRYSTCYILAQVQKYTLDTASDKPTGRTNGIYVIGLSESDNSALWNDTNTIFDIKTGGSDITSFELAIKALITSQLIVTEDSSKKTGIQLVKVFAIPSNIFTIQDYNAEFRTKVTVPINNENDKTIYVRFFNMHYKRVGSATPYYTSDDIVKQYTIPNNYLNVSFGFYTKRFNLKNNGMPTKITLKININGDTPIFLCETLSSIDDITEAFSYDIPFNTQTADIIEQRKINNELQNTQLTMSSINAGFHIATSVAGGVAGMNVGTVMEFNAANALDKAKASNTTIAGGNQFAGGIIGGIATLINNAEQRAAINAAKYANTYMNNVFPTAILNILYSFCIFRIEYTNGNFEDVAKMVNEVGYDVSFLTNEIKETLIGGYDYDIIKFDFIRLNGLPTSLNTIIKQILLNGTKIWYTSNV